MSFFRPHKSKPRQFNYIPRYYDPVKEERDQRRKELHGTSSLDEEEEYVPGKYIRTQREARDASRGDSNNGSLRRIRNLTIIAVIIGAFGLMVVPRFVTLATKAKEEREAEAAQQRRLVFTERIDDVDGIDNHKLFMEELDNKEAWQRTHNVIFEGMATQEMYLVIQNIIEEEMAGESNEAINAAFQEAIKEPEKWLQEHANDRNNK